MLSALRRHARHGIAAGLVATTAGAAGCGISQQQELELGAQYAAQINRELPLVDDAAVLRYVNQIGNQLARAGARNIDYHFYVVNTDVLNAFAVPGGHVYVNRGLIEATDNLSELAGVMAHEIAHVEERHGVEQLERMQQANLGLSVAYILLGRAPSGLEEAAINVGGGLVFAQYGRDAENEADAVAVPLMVNAGIHPRGLVTFFEELIEERQRRPSALEQWFSTHPLTEERIASVRRIIDGLPRSSYSGLPMDSNAYANMKAQLRRYAAPPAAHRSR